MAECLDFHIVSQGNGPRHALAMVREALQMTFEHDIAHDKSPFSAHRPSPELAWHRLWDIVRHGDFGQPGQLEAELGGSPHDIAGGVALQLALDLVLASWRTMRPKRITIDTVPVAIRRAAAGSATRGG
jgi:hypothetical protein